MDARGPQGPAGQLPRIRVASDIVRTSGGKSDAAAVSIDLDPAAVSRVLRGLGTLPDTERPAVGALANRIKGSLEARLEARRAAVESKRAAAPRQDLTLPGRPVWTGTLHPVSQVMAEIWGIFRDLGFTRARGPEAETEWYNFVALNTPLDHPAADEQDTLYLSDSALLRSHTSPVQIRTMESQAPPIYVVAPGRTYRNETLDARHSPVFHQIECLAIDRYLTMADLFGTIEAFVRLDLPGTKVLVGDGPQREELAEKYPDVVFRGAMHGQKLADHYACADVFVFPSLTDTFGLVILEAMASGLPVAAYPAPGPIDIIPGSNAGVLAATPTEGLREACLAADRLDRATVRAYAEKFSWRACAEEFVRNLEPYPEPQKTRFWRRLRRLARLRRKAIPA